jgi:hypothetical protein
MHRHMYCFVPPFCRSKFYGVPSQAVVKFGCAMGKERLQNTGLNLAFQGKTWNRIILSL